MDDGRVQLKYGAIVDSLGQQRQYNNSGAAD
jgi:hypothetical protein